MTRKATTTTPDPELSTPLGNEPDQRKVPGKSRRTQNGDNMGGEEENVPEPLEVEQLEGRQESGRDD